MSTTKHTGSPEEQATERWPGRAFPCTPLGSTALTSLLSKREGYATCLRERAIPAGGEVEGAMRAWSKAQTQKQRSTWKRM